MLTSARFCLGGWSSCFLRNSSGFAFMPLMLKPLSALLEFGFYAEYSSGALRLSLISALLRGTVTVAGLVFLDRLFGKFGLPLLYRHFNQVSPPLLPSLAHSRSLLVACRKISQHGTMLQALCRTWALFGQGTPRLVLGRAIPQTCPDCGALLPSKHALAAHAHRMHGPGRSMYPVLFAFGASGTFKIPTDSGTTSFIHRHASTGYGVWLDRFMSTVLALRDVVARVTPEPQLRKSRGP